MASSSSTTTDHETIRKWTEERNGRPATVTDTGDPGDPGVLRIMFEGGDDHDRLEEISWEKFFETFEESQLAFLYQDETKGGEVSRFFKLVRRD
ncbi:MAG: hypothetical protein R3349_03045 [Geminicoccaceae bacterium]|nr:hypothetical protein [Geminicoccaceae bacterium]